MIDPQVRYAGTDPLWVAAVQGNLRKVDALISAGAPVSTVNSAGATILHKAVEQGHVEIAQRLIRAGIHVDVRDAIGKTPLHYAARRGASSPIATALIHAGADVNARGDDGRTPAMAAARRGLLEIFNLLVAAGADPIARARDDRSVFDLSLAKRHDRMAVALLHRYPDLAPAGEALDAAFVEAVCKNCVGVAKLLAERGADLGQKPEGRTLAQCAPRGTQGEEMKRLLRSLKTGELIASAMDAPNAESLPPPRLDTPIL